MKAIHNGNMTTEVTDDGLTFRSIGFLSKNQLEGTLLDIVSIALGYTTVPL